MSLHKLFLLKLNAVDIHHSVDTVVTLFRSLYEIDVYPRKNVRIFSNIMGQKLVIKCAIVAVNEQCRKE